MIIKWIKSSSQALTLLFVAFLAYENDLRSNYHRFHYQSSESGPLISQELNVTHSQNPSNAHSESISLFPKNRSSKKPFFAGKKRIFSSSASEQKAPNDVNHSEQSDAFYIPKRVTMDYDLATQSDIPFGRDYATLTIVWAPIYTPGQWMPMIDLRGHRFKDNTYAANVGLIARYIPDECCVDNHIFGLNFYYDYRQGNIGYFNQFGAGLEVLGCRWDFRANVYVPFGPRRHLKHCVFDDFIGDFLATRDRIEYVSYALNGEVGWLAIDYCEKFFFYLAGGPYFLAGTRCKNTLGGEFRIRPQYKDFLALDLSVRHDSVFETIWQALIIFSLPLYEIPLRGKTESAALQTDRSISPLSDLKSCLSVHPIAGNSIGNLVK